MSQPFPGNGLPTNKPYYFTLENGDQPGALHTCGDTVRAKVHLHPRGTESLSVSNLRVNFKCKARTVITTGTGNSRRIHKSSVYLFWFSSEIFNRRGITVNSHQSWDVEFQFPWTALPHPTQNSFAASPVFPHQAGHRLPPTWWEDCRGRTQSVEYYLESTMNRQGRMMEHEDKDRLPLLFSPPLDIPDPAPSRKMGRKGIILRTSRLLDPVKREEHYGFRERSKNIFSSNQDPTAKFVVAASAPTVCCVGDALPITLHISYDQNSSTALEQPEVFINSFHVRLNDYSQFRVPTTGLFGDSELCRDSDNKIIIAQIVVPGRKIVYDGMSLNDIAPLGLHPTLGPSFATFSISRHYMLKVSAIFHCAGKDYDLIILRHLLTVHPARSLYKPLPGASPSPMQPVEPRVDGGEDGDETLPPYVAGSTQGQSDLPSYEQDAAQKLPSSAVGQD